MNIDKVKVLRIVSLMLAILGITNMVASRYGYGIPDAEIEFYANLISYASTVIFGITIESKAISALFKGRGGV
ncbi:hypothetical protein [Paenibacillus sp. Root444D2]|uniref:hypothetical protein n=1 Tax=Paenibacillus sp. Root444D2 TaxID=1736538 RepID=UPI00070BBDD1|nr:hypothetical protein [Paenibacillus sp. Root444D2]KQX69210.1 hypothetical protein ASD40_01550 [Paenibacillus sp. Root444D2]